MGSPLNTMLVNNECSDSESTKSNQSNIDVELDKNIYSTIISININGYLYNKLIEFTNELSDD